MTDGRTDGRTNGRKDGRTDGRTDRQSERQTDKLYFGWYKVHHLHTCTLTVNVINNTRVFSAIDVTCYKWYNM